MTRVLVLSGGDSAEREVSLRSGAAVSAALQAAGYESENRDSRELAQIDLAAYDVVFPALHGVGGEDGSIQQKLEDAGVKFVGSDAAASALCFHTAQWRDFVGAHRLPVAWGAVVTADTVQSHPLAQLPFVLKPFDGGSSIDTFIVRDAGMAPWQQIGEAFQRHQEMLIEQLIEGIEITVAVLGDRPLPVIEIIPPENGEFDYDNKYNGASQELCPPAHINPTVQEKAQRLALQVHELCGCRDLSRTDMIAQPSGDLVLLETNTIPGLTDESLLPKAAATAGLSMQQLCSELVELALAR